MSEGARRVPRTLFAICGIGLAAWCFGRATADEAGPAPWRPTSVALVDLAKIFKDSPRLGRLREDLRRDFEIEGATLKRLGEGLKELQARAQAAKDDPAAQKTIRGEFEGKSNEFKAEAQRLQKEFVAREVELYRLFYADVKAEVERFAKDRGITLVVRWSSTDEPLPEITEIKDAPQVMSRINQLIVFHDSLDITDAVIDRMRASGSL